MTSSPISLERSPSSRSVLALALWAALAALQIVSSFALGGGSGSSGGEPIYDWSLGLGSLLLYAILVALTIGVAGLLPDTRAALGLRRFSLRFAGLAAGVVVASLLVSVALEPLLHAGEEQGLTPDRWRGDRLAPFLLNAVVIATVVPFGEELFYRGLGVRVLGVFGRTTAVVGSAVVFGLAHGILAALPPLVFFGLGLAWVRVRSASIWPGVLAHGAYNALGLALAVAAT